MTPQELIYYFFPPIAALIMAAGVVIIGNRRVAKVDAEIARYRGNIAASDKEFEKNEPSGIDAAVRKSNIKRDEEFEREIDEDHMEKINKLEMQLQRQINSNVRMLDQLPTAVAMFDVSQRLIFHNAAYRQLWDLDPAFLDGRPYDSEILDHLRAQRKLEEQADFRRWKQGVLTAYQSAEAHQSWWYLPDGRTLRVVADPNPQGGLTYLFDDVSDSINAESRYNALRRLQAETLHTLAEPVAVFGADGRLQFANRAFSTLWRLDASIIEARPHIDTVIEVCRSLAPAEGPWFDIRDAVVGNDPHIPRSSRLELTGGEVLDCAINPLPEGATILSLIDVTTSVVVERALVEKNDVLEKAAQFRNAIQQNISYELRSPLTNIIGFTHLLGDETVGVLNERQREYYEHIMHSSGALLAIINDLLDLASLDAGSLKLHRETVNVRDVIDAAVRGVQDRLAASKISLKLDVPDDIGSLQADGKRIRQIIFNLLSNAIGLSDAGQRVELRARREAPDLILSVRDHGRGIPPEIAEPIFNNLEINDLGGKYRNFGISLSIVRSLVELHGGRVRLETAPGRGTYVTCSFPLVADKDTNLGKVVDLLPFLRSSVQSRRMAI